MKQFVFLILALVAMLMVLGLCSKSPTTTPTPTPPTVRRQDPKPPVEKPSDEKPFDLNLFKDKAMQSLGPWPATWNMIRFETTGRSMFRLHLVYHRMPSDLHQVENDTKRIARAVLKV